METKKPMTEANKPLTEAIKPMSQTIKPMMKTKKPMHQTIQATTCSHTLENKKKIKDVFFGQFMSEQRHVDPSMYVHACVCAHVCAGV